MQDYYNMANLQQSGQGRNSQRLPIAVLDGVPYYTASDYQRALDAKRIREQQVRANNDPGLGQMNLPVQSGMDLNTVSGSQAQGMSGGTVPDFASAAMDAQRMTDMSQNSMSMSGSQEPSFVTAARQQQVMNTSGAREQQRVEDMQREQRANAAADRAQTGTTISGVGTIQNGQVFRNDRTNYVPGMGNMNLPEQATVDPALVSATTNAGMEDPFATAQAIQANSSGFAAGSSDFIRQATGVNQNIVDPTRRVVRQSPVTDISLTPGSTQGGTSVSPTASAYREGELKVSPDGQGVQTFDEAKIAADEAKAAADKAAIDAKVTAARQEQFDAAQAEQAAAKTAQAEQAAAVAGTDIATATSDAYQTNLANILESIELRKQQAGETYSDMYQQALTEQTRARGLSDLSGLSGGMAEQARARRSVAETAALTNIGAQRQQAVDAIEAEKLGAELQAGRMTAEQFELEKQTNPMYQYGELLAQRFNATGDVNDFNVYMNHMATLIGVEAPLLAAQNPEGAQAQLSETVRNQVLQYAENPTLMQKITGFGTGGFLATVAGFVGIKSLEKIGMAYVGKGLAGAFGTAAAAKGGLLAGAAGLAGAAAPVIGAVVAGAFAVMAISSLVSNIRRSKTGEAAKEAIDKVFAEERQRLIDSGFTEEQADQAIADFRKTELAPAFQ